MSCRARAMAAVAAGGSGHRPRAGDWRCDSGGLERMLRRRGSPRALARPLNGAPPPRPEPGQELHALILHNMQRLRGLARAPGLRTLHRSDLRAHAVPFAPLTGAARPVKLPARPQRGPSTASCLLHPRHGERRPQTLPSTGLCAVCPGAAAVTAGGSAYR